MTLTSKVMRSKTNSGSLAKLILSVLVTFTLLRLNDHQVTAREQNSVEELNCEEAVPKCRVRSYFKGMNFDNHLIFNKSSNVVTAIYLINSSLLYPACSLNPVETAPSLRHASSTIFMKIICSEPGTRIVITTDSEYVMPSVSLVVWITSCAIYWKDLSKLGRLFAFDEIILDDWQDEFMTEESEYFDACVEVQPPKGASDKSDVGRTIAGCTNIVVIQIKNSNVRGVSPVFACHLWPVMLQLVSER